MSPIKKKKCLRIALIAIAVAALLGVAAHFHFRDDPEPDLSHHRLPALDPVVVAETEAKIAAFKAAFKPYAPASAEEYDEDTEEKPLIDSALDGDPRALRSLRRHLADNAASLPHAKALAGATRYAIPEVALRESPLELTNIVQPETREAVRLVLDKATLAAIDGDFDIAWQLIGRIIDGARPRNHAARNMASYLTTSVALDNRTRETITRLAQKDTDPARLTRGLHALSGLTPDAKHFARVADGELFILRLTLPRLDDIRSANENLLASSAEPQPAWKRLPGSTVRTVKRRWRTANTLPNATLVTYDQGLEPLRRITDAPIRDSAEITLTDSEPHGSWKRNFGGEALSATTRSLANIFRKVHGRSLASHRLTRLALALRIHQLTHDGKLPESLEVVATQFAPEDLVDPFGGAPFHYDPRAGILWSVGDDLKDNHGVIDEYGDSSDIVVRITASTSAQ